MLLRASGFDLQAERLHVGPNQLDRPATRVQGIAPDTELARVDLVVERLPANLQHRQRLFDRDVLVRFHYTDSNTINLDIRDTLTPCYT